MVQDDRYIFNDIFSNIRNSKKGTSFIGQQELESERFPCYKCGSTYKQKTHLIRHVKHECGMEPQFCCPQCPKRYKQKNTLRLHMYRHHY